jgi:hypothetical protein
LGSSLNPPVTPSSGQWLASLFAIEPSETSQLWQSVTLPSGTVYMRFYMWIDSTEMCDVPWYDSLVLYINGTAVDNQSICHYDSTGGWLYYYYDLSSYNGQTIQIGWEVSTLSDGGGTTVYLDDFSIGSSH